MLLLAIFAVCLAVVKESRAREIFVADVEALVEAVREAVPGDTILLEAGVYEDCSLEIDVVGTETKPLVIRGADRESTVIGGQTRWELSGEYIQIENLRFRGLEDRGEKESSGLVIVEASFCRITNCVFEENEALPLITVSRSGVHNRIDQNRFSRNPTVHLYIDPNRTTGEYPLYTRIDHNTFSDVPMIPKGNGREIMKIGRSPYTYGDGKAFARIEFNTFTRCDGEPEIISNKCSANVFRGNRFIDCEGELVMRGGHDCVIMGNTFENCTGGIRLSGSRHLVLNNTVRGSRGTDRYLDVPNAGSGIRLVYGADVVDPAYYFAVSGCLIAHNTIEGSRDVGIELGTFKDRDLVATSSDGGKGWDAERLGVNTVLAVAPFDNRIVSNVVSGRRGTLIRSVEANENVTASNRLIAFGGVEVGFISERDEVLAEGDVSQDLELEDLSEFLGFESAQPGTIEIDLEAQEVVIKKWIQAP